MEEDFRALLQSDGAVSGAAQHINFGAHPQGQALPAVVLNTIGMQQGMTLDGPERHTVSRMQVDCYADTYGAAKMLSRAVIARCHGHRDADFQGIMLIDVSDSRIEATYGAAADQPYRVSIDFRVVHNQTQEG